MIIFLVEDYSMRKFLEGILPRLGFTADAFEIKHHQGKEDLLGNLTQVIPTLSKRAKHIVVLIDQDRQDCIQLKQKLKEKVAWCACDYTLRIACYELESWFLGDLDAITQCSERFRLKHFQNKQKYQQTDNIVKPSTDIETIVPDWKTLYSSKPKFAEKMSQFIALEPEQNRSCRFSIFLKTLYELRQKYPVLKSESEFTEFSE